jgi:hypothetical protein
MNKNKIKPIRESQIFAIEVEKRWNKIPEAMKNRILNTVWCSNCAESTSIILESSKMEQKDLIVRGKCKACGHKVCRVVEPEE